MTVLGTLLIALYFSKRLPSPVAHSQSNLSSFSEERARAHLTELLKFGPARVVGSYANEVQAPEYIEKVVEAMARECGTHCDIEVSRHVGSGSFYLDFLGGFTSTYENVQNVLVLLKGLHPPEDGMLMLSAHYDSAVGVPAASDNAANVANLLEILRAYTTSERPEFSVLFIFNGAEETILQGSHSFTLGENKHKYSEYVRAFINLEAAGAGGRELMFQTSRNDLADSFARAAPVSCSVCFFRFSLIVIIFKKVSTRLNLRARSVSKWHYPIRYGF